MTATIRSTRLSIRADDSEKERIEFAARLCHLSVSDFVRSAAEARAEEVIASQYETRLSLEDFAAFHAALDMPDEPNEARRRIAAAPSPFVQK